MRGAATGGIGVLMIATLASSGCWNRIEVHPRSGSEQPAAAVETRVLGWSEESSGDDSEAGVVAQVDDGERTYHVVVGEDGRGRSWSAAFCLDE